MERSFAFEFLKSGCVCVFYPSWIFLLCCVSTLLVSCFESVTWDFQEAVLASFYASVCLFFRLHPGWSPILPTAKADPDTLYIYRFFSLCQSRFSLMMYFFSFAEKTYSVEVKQRDERAVSSSFSSVSVTSSISSFKNWSALQDVC